jgi:hypothetical protein
MQDQRVDTRSDQEREQTRAQFKALLLGNLNYFGNVPESPLTPQLPIQLDTTFEELVCVGYEPQLRRLEGVVYIKRESGYGGDICSVGTPEFVRFFLSFDGGATWQDQGMTSFTAFDIPGDKPLEFDVSLQISPDPRLCLFENLPLVRAILSWNNPPTAGDPNFTPVYGNVLEAQIQIAATTIIIFDDLLKQAKLQLPGELQPLVDVTHPLPLAKAQALGPAELQDRYRGQDVPDHRFLFPEVHKLVTTPGMLDQDPAGPASTGPLAGLDIDLAAVINATLETDGNISFEELDCIGLNPTQSILGGVLTIKRSTGYSGPLCFPGSYEYVAFWGDFGAGFVYLGTTSVNVHDLNGVPPQGLKYAVVLPVNLTAYQRPCEQGPVVVRIRAILSWQVPPPPGNPDFVPTWGNREETLVHIRPGDQVGDDKVPFLSALGDIPESDIATTGTATGTAIHTGFQAADSPFGGTITIAGHIANPTPGLKYRVMRKLFGAPDTDYLPLTSEPGGLLLIVNTWDPVNGWVQTPTTVHADPDGYYPFEDYAPNHAVEGNIMGRWSSTAAEDGQTFELRIDLSVDANPINDTHSNVVAALVDNTPPDVDLDIDLGAGVQCADFTTGTTFTGTYTATDDHFRRFAFEIQPSGPAHGILPAPASGTSTAYGGAIPDPGVTGATYTLDTNGMDACGYALLLHVWDRTNVNSGAGNNYDNAAVGFCLRAP